MRMSMKKYLAAVVAMSALLQLTAYAGPGFSASSSRAAAAAANAQYEAAAQQAAAQQAAQQKAQNSTGTGASINMNSINQGTVSPAEAMAIGQKLATVNGMSVTYQLPNNQTEVLDGLTIATWVNGSQGLTVSVDAAKVAAYVQGLRNKYDTPAGTQTWQSADGTAKSIKTDYGWHIDQAKETEALIANIQSLQSVTREPVYASRAVQTEMPQWGKTFVEIDISSQHVYFYQNGNCVWDSKCVTGTATDPDRATPTGVFALKYKQRDRVLRGRINPQTGKPSYESPVAYWMPFNGNIGLHDANWRSSFGGNIYLKNGSHGCINLPPKNAKTLYELITPGTVIVVCD